VVISNLGDSDTVTFIDSLSAIQNHLDESALLTDAEIRNKTEDLLYHKLALLKDQESIQDAFLVIDSYDQKYSGAIFMNTITYRQIERVNDEDGLDIHRAVIQIQQILIDVL